MTELVKEPESGVPAELEVRGASALFSFEGRINRGTFWKIFVANAVLGSVASAIATGGFGQNVFEASAWTALVSALLGILSAWQMLALTVKRWHDIGSSGWYTLLGLIPLVNIGVMFYLAFGSGDEGPNEYGDAPHDINLI